MSRGYHAGYWDQFGVPHEKMLGRFLESVKIWKEAFKGERFDFDGKHWQVEQGLLTPGPYQEGGWPIWGGGNASPEAIRRSATYGEAMTADPCPKMPDVWNERVGAYKAAAEELGKKPFIVMMRDGWVADTFEKAAEQFGTHFVEEWMFYYRLGIFTGHPELQTEADITPENAPSTWSWARRSSASSSSRCSTRSYGVDYFTMRFRFPTGPSMEAAHEQIRSSARRSCSRSTRSTRRRTIRRSRPPAAGRRHPAPRGTVTPARRTSGAAHRVRYSVPRQAIAPPSIR